MNELHTFQSEFESVLQEKHVVRCDIELANLMVRMEQHYEIPMLKDQMWENQHTDIIQLYRTISDTRSIVESLS